MPTKTRTKHKNKYNNKHKNKHKNKTRKFKNAFTSKSGGNKRSLNKTKKKSTTNKKTKSGFTTATCSPFVHDEITGKNKKQFEFTCYDEDALLLLKNAWNSRHSRDGLSIKSDDPKTIWNSLKNYMSKTCDIESCWLKENFMQNIDSEKFNKLFAPDPPSQLKNTPDNYLTTLDILEIMKQYEKLHDNFKFIGPSPIDYDTIYSNGSCVWDELCNFNLKKYIDKNIDVIGIIFNLDEHNKGGSHWVAVIIDNVRKQICFFCSYGYEAEKNIITFIDTVTKQSEDIYGTPYQKIHNKFEYQGDTNECGIYCMYVIINMIKGKSFYNIVGKNKKKKDFNDKKMYNLRHKYFYNDL